MKRNAKIKQAIESHTNTDSIQLLLSAEKPIGRKKGEVKSYNYDGRKKEFNRVKEAKAFLKSVMKEYDGSPEFISDDGLLFTLKVNCLIHSNYSMRDILKRKPPSFQMHRIIPQEFARENAPVLPPRAPGRDLSYGKRKARPSQHNSITLKDLCKKAGVTPKQARIRLRKSNFEKKFASWVFLNSEIEEVLSIIKEG